MVRFSTAGVNNYDSCSGNDLDHCIEQADAIRSVYEFAGFQGFTHWRNGDVWGSDFRDASSGDMASDGGSDIPDIYYYSGHGTCQDPPVSPILIFFQFVVILERLIG